MGGYIIARRRGRSFVSGESAREEIRVREQLSGMSGAGLDDRWRRVREELRSLLPESTYRLWLEPLRPVHIRGRTIYITGPERVLAWVERRYADLVHRAVCNGLNVEAEVLFVSARDVDADARERPAELRESIPDHSFERFVIGGGNRVAHAAALAVAESPGQAYNPLFLHGPPGLGKTHLLGAIANYTRHHSPDLVVRYSTAERFTSEFVSALQTGGIDAFKDRYRGVDILLMDDVQFFEGKARTADEFFHTFNALFEAGAQVVLSADRVPVELFDLAERLRGRFEWGLIVELEPPDLDTRIAVLERLGGEADAAVQIEALRDIAKRSPANLRAVRGALTRVLALSSVLSTPIDTDLVRRAFGDGPDSREKVAPSAGVIQEAVCIEFDITRDQLLSSSRSQQIVSARHLAMHLTRDLTDLSLPRIARAFHRRDHTTVIHAIRGLDERLAGNPDLSALRDRLRQRLTANASGPS